ncbi:MAG: sialate O-acetylesterase [Planctomycetes bacterium]|nr:sialate O-acetylesterase [Planctomycetota bacterium]
MRPFKAVLLALGASVFALGTARADVKPHPIFSDNMVLQQGTDIVVWGTAAPNEGVNVTLERKGDGAASTSASGVKADDKGNWSAKFGKQKAGTGYTITIEGKNKIEFKNVAVGEVWVCSGQSNMEWSVNASETPQKVKDGSKNADLRLFTVNKRTAAKPITDQSDLTHFTKWVEAGPDTVGGFSAVGLAFGQKLQKELGVPVGLIHSSWGGTPAQAWTSLEALDADPMLKYYADAARATAKAADDFNPKAALEAYEKAHAAWKIAADKAKADNKPVPKEPAKPSAKPAAPGPGSPSVLYNAMIYPMLSFKTKGAIWYQGESNAGKAYEYRTLFTAMIKDWRKQYNCDLPFMLVQLAPFRGGASGVDYAELRDAQLYAAKSLPKTGIAVITDLGNETDIHPKPKQPVGERLALAALGIEYGKKIVYYGPTLKDAKYASGTATLTFDNVGGGLVAKDGDLVGFTVAGKDGKFHPAKATIKGDTVVLTCEMVPEPAAVRFGWVNFAKPTLNFFNKEGLPATPFRTDDAPYTTQPKPKK